MRELLLTQFHSTPFYPSLLVVPIISLCSHCLYITSHSLLRKPHATLEGPHPLPPQKKALTIESRKKEEKEKANLL